MKPFSKHALRLLTQLIRSTFALGPERAIRGKIIASANSMETMTSTTISSKILNAPDL